MGSFGTLGQLKRQGKLKPYTGPMPRYEHETSALAHHYPLHVAQAMEEYWRTKVKGCAECKHNARLPMGRDTQRRNGVLCVWNDGDEP